MTTNIEIDINYNEKNNELSFVPYINDNSLIWWNNKTAENHYYYKKYAEIIGLININFDTEDEYLICVINALKFLNLDTLVENEQESKLSHNSIILYDILKNIRKNRGKIISQKISNCDDDFYCMKCLNNNKNIDCILTHNLTQCNYLS